MKNNNIKTAVCITALATACLLPICAHVYSPLQRCMPLSASMPVNGNMPDNEVLPPDTIRTDTLREVTVNGDTSINVPISNSVKNEAGKKSYSLGAIIQRKAAKANDVIMHPFGWKERKKSSKRKRTQKALEDYDAIQDPLQHFLDSLEQAHKK